MDLKNGTLFSKNNQDKLEQFAEQLKSVHIELNYWLMIWNEKLEIFSYLLFKIIPHCEVLMIMKNFFSFFSYFI